MEEVWGIGSRLSDEKNFPEQGIVASNALIHDNFLGYFKQNFREKYRIIVDGAPIRGISGVEFLPKGDDLIPQCGAASVIAKHARDESADREKRKSWKSSK